MFPPLREPLPLPGTLFSVMILATEIGCGFSGQSGHPAIEFADQHIPPRKPATIAVIVLAFQGLVTFLHHRPLPTNTDRIIP